jgi:hypothetical protein
LLFMHIFPVRSLTHSLLSSSPDQARSRANFKRR